MASLVVNTFPQAFLEVLHHSLQHGGRNCCHFVPDVLFQVHRCPWFLFIHLALEISSEEEVLRLGTLVPMSIEVPTKYLLSQDKIVVFEIRLHSKSPVLYRPELHGNWNALSLARRALKDKFPTPTIPLTTVLQNRQVFLPHPLPSAFPNICLYANSYFVECEGKILLVTNFMFYISEETFLNVHAKYIMQLQDDMHSKYRKLMSINAYFSTQVGEDNVTFSAVIWRTFCDSFLCLSTMFVHHI